MRYGSVVRSIARSLDSGASAQGYAPDGLDEAAIDDLMDEALADVPFRPSWRTSDVAEQRRVCRRVRQIVRLLPRALTTPVVGPSAENEVA